MLGTAGAIGAQARVPAMVLMRPALGRRGSYAATALNVVQNLGWAIFELIVIATAAAALSDQVFGFEGKWLWTVLFGLLTAAMALAGPIAVVRRVRPPLRALGRARLARLPHVVDDRQRRPRHLLVAARRRRVGVVRHRPHDRLAGLVAAADRRLHALLARPAIGVRRLRHRLPRPECMALRSRRRARPYEPGLLESRRDRADDIDRRGRARRGPRPPRTHRRRDRRGVRERLLDGRLAAERPAARAAAAPDRASPPLPRLSVHSSSPGRSTRRSSSSSARSSCRCSACFWRTGCWRAGATRARTSSRRRRSVRS